MTVAVAIIATQKKNSYLQKYSEFQAAAVTMDNSGVQDIVTIDVSGLTRISVRLLVATNALAAFVIKGLVNSSDTTWLTLKSTGAQYTTPGGILVDVSGDLTSLAVGSGWFVLDVAGFDKIRLAAKSSAAGGSTLAIFGAGI